MKKLSAVLALVMAVTVFATACGKDINSSSSNSNSSNNSAVTTAAGDTTTGGDNTSSADPNVTTVAPSGNNDEIPNFVTTTITTAIKEIAETSKVRYTYDTLTAEEKEIYQNILISATNFASKVEFDKPIPFKTYQKIYGLVYFQEVHLFWLKGVYPIKDGDVSSMPLLYTVDHVQAEAMRAEIDTSVKKILATIPAGASDTQKLKVLYDYICLNNEFSWDGKAFKNSVQTIYGAFVEGFVQCEGYAKAMGYLCDLVGIENMLITGTDKDGGSHAWNIVKVNGEWSNIDTTWGDPASNTDVDYVRYNYFMVKDDEIINKSHFHDLTYYTPPAVTADDAKFYKELGLYAANIDEVKSVLTEQLTIAGNNKVKQVQIKVANKDVLNKVKSDIFDNKEIFNILKAVNEKSTNKFKTSTYTPAFDENVLTVQIGLNYE